MALAEITFVGVSAAAIHALVAWAFITRYPPRNLVASHDLVAALPSLALSGMVSQLAGPPSAWPWFCQALFTCGALITVISICHLGQSFAVLPHDRPLVTGGAYRYIRHPMYLGETLMLLGCCTTQTQWSALALMILSLSAIAIRINVEESRLLLSNAQSFNDYTSQVRWRLVPFVW
jgi:protein-S-isoprenylcysteine O-methyltransferase Ste14